ncbi:39S ribosomal protein L42, mitochondrial [Holothuria leucospilota]|uniref:Large ribosomal subunit protein mL42 n=1 Tax=Holothuria leucospilota TaxID=206669 RepID=A0A9Q1CLP1_HOLLE|nr:39S ribosomal protein L42, mitochondrial [Holothuria leucospilota]
MVGSSKPLARCVSSHSSPKICETSDKSCIVCYHPTNPFAYQNTRPIPRPDPSSPKEAVEGVLKVKFQSERWAKEKEGPTPEELGKMFYTTKHRWYPIGIRRRMVKRPKPARERPYL